MTFTLSSWDPCKRNHILKAFLLTALLLCCVRGSTGQVSVIPDAPVARVGQTVTLHINHTLSALSAAWYKGSPVIEANTILTYSFTSNVTATGPWYHPGKEAALPDGSLRISGVWRNHTGPYTVRILLQDGIIFHDASAEIGVYVESMYENLRNQPVDSN